MANNNITKRTQAERIAIAETLLSSVWEDFERGIIDEEIMQVAVNAQVDIDRIVWKLNALNAEGI